MKDYHTTHKVNFDFKEEFQGRYGFDTVPVLEFLKGHKWDEVALAYVAGLKPDSIRVTTGTITTDGDTGRITVYTDENDIIKNIEFGITVGLPDKVAHAGALKQALIHGIDSPQCQFFNDDEIYMYYWGLEGVLYKTYKDKDSVMFPYPKGHPFCQDFENENQSN